MSLDARIHHVRLRLDCLSAVFSSDETHDVLREALGEAWEKAVEIKGSKTEAAKLLLGYQFDGKGHTSFFDKGLRTPKGPEQVLERLEIGHLG